MHPDQKYISYLQEHHSGGIDEIYRLYAGKVKKMILANNGSEEEAADIFQETLVDIYKLSLNKDFVLTCSFEAFLIIICKRKWLSYLKTTYKKKVTNLTDHIYTFGENEVSTAEEYALKIEKENTVHTLLEKLGDKCKEIIKACLQDKNQEKIAAKLGISYAYLRKRKSLCMAELTKMVREHHLFKK